MRKISNEIDKTVFQFFEHLSEMDSEKYNPEDMAVKWKEWMKNNKSSANSSKLTKDGRPRKVSAYVNFCKQKREELRKQGLTFGEISKELGRQWKSLSKDEKDTYLSSSSNEELSTSPDIVKSPPPADKKKTKRTKKKKESPKATPEDNSAPTTPEKATTFYKNKKDEEDESSSVNGSETSPSPSVSPVDFNKLLMPEIKKMCKEKGLDIKKKSRAELIEMLKKTDTNDDEDEDYSHLLDEEEEETLLG